MEAALVVLQYSIPMVRHHSYVMAVENAVIIDNICIEAVAFIGDETQMDDQDAARVVCKSDLRYYCNVSKSSILI
jgi:hypothetical protein